MRPKERIRPILDDIEKIWVKNQDLRLGQLLIILVKTYGAAKTNDIFYVEDGILEIALDKYKKMHDIK